MSDETKDWGDLQGVWSANWIPNQMDFAWGDMQIGIETFLSLRAAAAKYHFLCGLYEIDDDLVTVANRSVNHWLRDSHDIEDILV